MSKRNSNNQKQQNNSNLVQKSNSTDNRKEWGKQIKINTGKIAEIAGKHPILTGFLGTLGISVVGGGIYMSHDVMKHGYDAEFSILNIFNAKLTKKTN